MPSFWLIFRHRPPEPHCRPDGGKWLGEALLCLLIACLLSGCASWQWLKTPTEQVAQQFKTQHYADALAIIDDTPPASPYYSVLQAQRPGIIQASEDYRHSVETLAKKLADKGHWQQAYILLERAHERVVSAEPVTTLLANLHDTENTQIRNLLTTWYLAQGKALLSTDGMDQELENHAGKAAQELLTERRRLYREVTTELTRLGKEYASQAHWQSAYRALEMAQRLDPDKKPLIELSRAREALTDARNQARSARQQAYQEQARKLVKQYKESNHLDDLLAARTFLAKHPGDDLNDERRQVKNWCQQRFQAEVSRGDALYASGYYRAAYQLWKQAQPLSPDDPELKKKLARAQKVLQSLEVLSEPQP